MLIIIWMLLLLALFLGALYCGYRVAFYYREPQADPLDYERDTRSLGLEDKLDQAIRVFWEVPFLLIHGDADDFVPYAMSQNLWRAAPDKIEFHTIPGVGHARNQIADPQRYGRFLRAFFARCLS